MEFLKERVYTALNADELKVGSKVYLADDLADLRHIVETDYKAVILSSINPESFQCRFCEGITGYALAYLVEEPEGLKWTEDEMKDRISMALKDPILQQGFEIICKENAELKTKKIPQLERKIASIRGAHSVDCKKLNARTEQVERLKKENAELKEQIEKMKCCENCKHYKPCLTVNDEIGNMCDVYYNGCNNSKYAPFNRWEIKENE